MSYDVLFMGLAFPMAPMGALLRVKPWQPHGFLWAAVGASEAHAMMGCQGCLLAKNALISKLL